MLIIHGDLTI